ncbi:MAG TPA: SURF1 family protein [Longimicrobium sp.]|nr:SURF1 family protein [Longimicrobium sp.]
MSFSVRGALGAAFILVMCAVCVRLGFWQLDRLEQRRARNAAVVAGLHQPPRAVDAALAAEMRRDPRPLVYRRVVARGRYLARGETVLRGRVDNGHPGVHLIAPLLLDDGAVMLVNRGWVPAPDGITPRERSAPPGGIVTAEGILQEVPITPDRGSPSVGRDTTYRRMDREVMGARVGRPILPMYVQLLGDSAAPAGANPALPVAVPLPPLDEGPHLGYAIQWFSFATIGIVGLIILMRRGKDGVRD